jgi:nucleoside-diphosphate-sugar epimerase
VRVLIAGCGYVGTAAGLELAQCGHVVYGLRRHPAALPAPLRPLECDLVDPGALATVVPEELDAVIYCASPEESTDQAYVDTYVRGLTHVLEALEQRQAPVKRVVLTTSTAVYGQQDGGWVDEASPTEPTHFSGRRLLEAERVLASSAFAGVSLRLAGIYGPGRTGLLRRVAAGTARLPARPRFSNRIHLSDCAGALAHLLTVGKPPSVIIGADDEPADQEEVLCWLAQQLGVAPPLREDPDNARAAGRGTTNKRCRNARLEASGYALRAPTFRHGYAPLITEHLETHTPPE